MISYGLITAPVSGWQFYDSRYTERYMKLLSTSTVGYNESAVRRVCGFLMQQDSGDDNVLSITIPSHAGASGSDVSLSTPRGCPKVAVHWS